jgi:hypothetical protein
LPRATKLVIFLTFLGNAERIADVCVHSDG